MARRRLEPRAFTTIETIAVLTVLSLLAWIAVPTFQQLTSVTHRDAVVLSADGLGASIDAFAATRQQAPDALSAATIDVLVAEMPSDVTVTPGAGTVQVTSTRGARTASACIDLAGDVGGHSTVTEGACGPGTDPTLQVTVTPDDAQLTVSFTPAAPAAVSAARATATVYELRATAPGQPARTVTGSGSPLTVGQLTNGVTYTLTLHALAGSTSTLLATASGTPIGVPVAPILTSATGADRAITLSWTATTTDARPVTGFHIYVNAAVVKTVAAAARSTTLTTDDLPTLANGTSYSVQVGAFNARGWDSTSNAVTATPRTTPSAPVITAVTAGSHQATVAFTAPATNGGAPVRRYDAVASAAGHPDVVRSSTTSPVALYGLVNDVTYTVTVTAVNDAGAGPGSAPVEVTPTDGPASPVITTTPGDASFTVTWVSASHPSFVVSGYRVYVDGVVVAIVPADATSAAVIAADVPGGLVNGELYTVQVSSYGPNGELLSVAASVRPRTTPDAPGSLSTTAGDGSLEVAFTAPASNGGAAVTTYTATASATGHPTVATAGAGSPLLLTGLVNNVTYLVSVTATNAVGTSPAATTTGTPAAPIVFTLDRVATTGGALTVDWTLAGANATDVRLFADGTLIATFPASAGTGTVGNLAAGYYEAPFSVWLEAVSDPVLTTDPYVVEFALAPAAPVLTAVTPGDGRLSVAFDPSAQAGTANGFTATAVAPDGTARTGTSSSSPIVVTGLTNGVPYTVSVVAFNDAGSSPASNELTGTPTAVPATPAVTVSPTDRGFTASWTIVTPPSVNSFALYVDDILVQLLTGATRSVAVTTDDVAGGLTNGVTYRVRVDALNDAGTTSSPDATVTPGTVPGAPTITGTTAGNGSAQISFAAPTDGGSTTVTGYTVTATSAGRATRTVSGAASPLLLSGLVNGVTYSVTVTATNASGTGPASAEATVTPLGAPEVPVITTLTPGDRSFAVSWTAVETAAAPIAAFRVYVDGVAVVDAVTTDRTATVTTDDVAGGLANGTSYALQVAAYNATGEVVSSVAVVVPRTTPDAPQHLTATGDDTSFAVSFGAPASDGGAAITGYTATATAPGQPTRTASGASSPLTITGITLDVTYTITVTATNDAGAGPAATTTARSQAKAATVSLDTLTAGDESFTVTWSGTGADGYEIRVDGSTVASVSAATTTLTVHSGDVTGGLINGTSYSVTVAARLLGADADTDTGTVTPRTIPGAATITAARGTDRGATIEFTAPSSDGGAAITGYTATATAAGQASVTATGSASPLTLTGLTNGVVYSVTVTPTNPAGAGPSSAPVNVSPMAAPAAPQITTISPADRSFSLAWTSAATTAAPVVSIEVRVDGTAVATLAPTTTALTVTATAVAGGLSNGTTYVVTVAAINTTGVTVSDPLTVTPRGVPTEPTITQTTGIDGGATVAFTVPASNGGSPITAYTVTATAAGQPTVTASGTASPLTVLGLANGVIYTLTMTATNAAGTGPASGPATVTPIGAPTAPVITALAPGNRSFTVTWTATASVAQPIDGFHVLINGTTAKTVNADTRTLTVGTAEVVGGLSNGVSYSIQVVAYNSDGATASLASAVTPSTVPNPPSITSTTAGDAQASVAFTAPTYTGGSPVTSYTLTATAAGQPTRSTTGTTSPLVVTGLTNGSTYSVSLVATNAAGNSTPATGTVTPYGVPAAVRSLTSTPGDGQVVLSWLVPTGYASGPAVVTSYDVEYSTDGTSFTPATSTAATTATVTGLTNGTTYTFRVRGVNAIGNGVWSSKTAIPYQTGVAQGTGDNFYGQLGDNSATSNVQTSYIDVYGAGALATVALTDLSASYWHTCAIGSGQAFCWGNGSDGRLGNGGITTKRAPTAVTNSGVLAGKTLTRISAGNDYSCAVDTDGVGYCWGANSTGQLGDGTTTPRSTPVVVNTTTPLKRIVTSSQASGTTCAITTSDTLLCWGNNTSGQLGDGTKTTRTSPTVVTGLAGLAITDVDLNGASTCATTSSGDLYCWGWDSGAAAVTTPAVVATPAVFSTISSGSASRATGAAMCGLGTDGVVYCRGNNASGLLGDGTTTSRFTWAAVDTSSVFGTTAVVDVELASTHACALSAAGAIACWGSTSRGLGTSSASLVPVKPTATLLPIDRIAVGQSYTVVLH